MKSFLVSCFLAVMLTYCAYGHMDPEKYGEIFGDIANRSHHFCKAITEVPQELIDGVREGQFPDVNSLKCYTTCLWVFAGSMNLDCTMNEKVLEKYMSGMNRNEDIEIMLECRKEACESDAKSFCEQGYELEKCIYEKVPNDSFIFY
uniref:Odorant-binding protein n=1 Tax=Galeruca daurica TaxID=1651263 RepID=A0A1U9W4Z7_9CUCU|nr:odorant-binding protein [Galeruca daurica]